MWFLAQSEPDNPSSHSSFALRLRGPLDVDRLRKSLKALVERHAILRTIFQTKDGIPSQKILDNVSLPLRREDLSMEENPVRELHTRITDLNQETFDISAAPPYRMVLFQLGADEYVLAVIIHHIVTDGWSAELFKRELMDAYEKLDTGVSPGASALISYADYACWQRSDAFSERIEPPLAYWQERLKAQADETQLPPDKPRPIAQSSHADTFWLKVSGEQLEELRRYSRQKNATQFVVLLASFCAALNRHIRQPFFNVGSFFANRPLPELENVMGPFVNGLVLRVDMRGDPSFDELVARTASAVIEAQQNQEAPIEKVIERVNPDRDQSRRTLFGVVFNFVNIPRLKQAGHSLDVDYFNFEAGTATYDLNVEFNQSEEGLNFAFEFNTDIYLRETIERFAGHFNHLLQQALADPVRPVGEFEILSSIELEQLDSWGGGVKQPASDIPVHRLFEEQAEKTPDAVAVMCGGQSITYADLNRRANQLARFLVKRGVKADKLVGISLPRSIDMVAALLAVMKAGGAYLPLDPAYPPEHLKYILDDARPVLVLADKSNMHDLPLESSRLVCLQDQLDEVEKEAASNPDAAVEANDLVYCIYTSGSTGRPKGVLVEHHSLVNFTLGAMNDYAITPADRMLQFASLNFDTSAEEIFPALCSGAALVLRTEDMLDSIPHFLQRCREWGITILDLPTAFWHELVLYLQKSEAGLPGALRLVIIGGERVSPAHVKTWHKLTAGSPRLDNTYGLTECTCVASRCELTPQERSVYGHREVTIGRAVENVRLYVLDPQMRRVPAGVSGELYVGGDCLARGYLNLPELTKERFIPDPFSMNGSGRLYRTGDVVQWRPDGTLEYLGRSDEQVKIRGFRIEPGEIESVLIRQPQVKDAIVVKRTDPAGTEQLAAYLLAQDGAEISIKDLKDAMIGKLPKYMLPACYQVLPEFPLSPNRKIDKNALPEPRWDELADTGSRALPANQAEEKMLAIWEQALGKQGIGVEDNFFDVGGHSLLAARMMTEVERVFGVSVPLVTLLEKPTIRALTRAIEDTGWKPTWKSLVSMKASGDREPIFLVHAIGGDILSYRRLVERLQDLDHPIYGVRAQGLGGELEPFTDIKEMAAFYLQEMKESQPHGPYYLGGYSFGGTVAYEMAQQLKAAGEEVAWLAMFDTVVLQNMPPDLRPGKLAMLVNELRRFWFVCLKFLRISIPKKKAYIKKLFGVLFGRLATLIKGEKYASPVEQQDHDRWQRKPPAFQKVELADKKALSGYIARPYAGRITLFKAKEREWSEMVDPKPLWQKLTREDLDIYVCDGSHRTILLEPYVISLAREMRASIHRAVDRMKAG
jgi:amino acid adenylation domain-containing protein